MCISLHAQNPTTAYRTTKSAQALIHFKLRKQTAYMVVASFPTAHTDEPWGNHCHRLLGTLPAKSAAPQISNLGFCHISLCISLCILTLSHNPLSDHTNRKMLGKQAAENKNNLWFYPLDKDEVFTLPVTSVRPYMTKQLSPQSHGHTWNRSVTVFQIMPESPQLNLSRSNFLYLVSW